MTDPTAINETVRISSPVAVGTSIDRPSLLVTSDRLMMRERCASADPPPEAATR